MAMSVWLTSASNFQRQKLEAPIQHCATNQCKLLAYNSWWQEGEMAFCLKNNTPTVATLALGSRPRQRGCKGVGQEEARESHQRLPGV
jgi:hypothetical protein